MREREKIREKPWFVFIYWCIHRLILVCALTRDQTYNLRVLRRCSNQLSYPARDILIFILILDCFWRWMSLLIVTTALKKHVSNHVQLGDPRSTKYEIASVIFSFRSNRSFKWKNTQHSSRASSSGNCRPVEVSEVCWFCKVRRTCQGWAILPLLPTLRCCLRNWIALKFIF